MDSAEVAALKQVIDAHLRKHHVYEDVREFIAAFAKSKKEKQQQAQRGPGDDGDRRQGGQVDDGEGDEGDRGREVELQEEEHEDVFDSLREQQVIQQVLESLETRKAGGLEGLLPGLDARAGGVAQDGAVVVPGEQYLLVKVVGGRAFADSGELGRPASTTARYVLRMQYCDQRFESRAVPCAEDPRFDASFLVRLSSKFSLQSGNASAFDGQVKGLRRLLLHGADLDEREAGADVSRMLHFVVLRTESDAVDGPCELVASHLMEWRRILANRGGASVVVELSALGPTGKTRMAAGVIELRLDLVPSHQQERLDSGAGATLSPGEIDQALQRETKYFNQAHRRFCEYARLWWQEYVEANPGFRKRMVKIFAENEWGDHYPACTFVSPSRGGRLVDTPQHAARFVSLIPYVREEAVGGGRMEVWHTMHSFLSKGQGDCEDHALLLCSLLLGFGLDAFVCVGTVQLHDGAAETDHVWVMTLSRAGRRGVIWESLTGQRIPREQLRNDLDDSDAGEALAGRAYRRIGCMFNNKSFYANKQLDDRVATCSLDVGDDMKWKAMDERLIAALRRNPPLPLREPTVQVHAVADAIERVLRDLITSEREEQCSLSTQWDPDLSYYLNPALSAYETERSTGVLFGNEEFQAIIKRHIPQGHSFKGFPTMLNHRDPHRIFHALRQNPIPADIMRLRADHTYFGLRVRVFAFPENVVAVWVMFAVRFRAS
ncbi:Centrosomal protein of 76 kDa (Cep76) [Durusdinium trenchii]|uniref:Centrosomal protein of 76 kDa n=1 Tax=Durusdinium trenchii TaxID=1381693 RepID=A0ABP0INL6_9DINO